jgi:DNA-directed RNA polymerase specialized sigma24 family protein
MASEGSVTVWIGDLKAGDHAAAQRLWERYFRKMVELARARLQTFRRRAGDEEDVALSAFYSFVRGAEGGRFQQLRDRDNLWPLLVVITVRKALDARKYETRKKRGGGKVRGESAWLNAADGSDHDGGINLVIGDEPTPAFVVELAEQTQRLLDALGSEELRQVAVWKMEGYSNQEIAAKLGRVERAVERRLRIIRGIFEQEMET